MLNGKIKLAFDPARIKERWTRKTQRCGSSKKLWPRKLFAPVEGSYSVPKQQFHEADMCHTLSTPTSQHHIYLLVELLDKLSELRQAKVAGELNGHALQKEWKDTGRYLC
jgi:hypothetical protein